MNRLIACLSLLLIVLLSSCGWIIGESNDATLNSLEVSTGTLEPNFSSDETSYTLLVSTDSFTITAEAQHEDADLLIKFNDGRYFLIGPGEEVILEPTMGKNTVEVKVVAEDGGATKGYKINVTRVIPVLSFGGSVTQATHSGLTYKNSSTSSKTIKGFYLTSLDLGPAGPCFGAIVAGSNTMGAMWSSIKVPVDTEIGVDGNYLYNSMMNFLYQITQIVGSPPADRPGEVSSWCITAALTTGTPVVQTAVPPSPLIINTISGNPTEEIIITCDDTLLTCTATPANEQIFPRL
jgi:hypothetical protein